MTDPAGSPGRRRLAALAVVSAVLAATVFTVIVTFDIGDDPLLARWFSPLGIAATAAGLVAAALSVGDRTARPVAVVAFVILVPCTVVAALAVVARFS
ncbi:hypothetical protein CLV46_1296 [Diaminobutyricimonas aerilata]|uniref:Uncharacterized protein n=1 Tax=Diaminobutyricimonas aerilata TaxID=1162967 RepID=A0A2M9CIK1_9MICO|nr:hypothetical protein [Diaminobutyricimonas aerilata]PJJ71743.1 hypothetical protein CLV46_1296 [Diaminobutyricimonas aerilata]